MAEATIRNNLLGRLREFPFLYRSLRTLRRIVKKSFVETARSIGKNPHLGAAKGFYSGLEQIVSGASEGRMILEEQKLPPLPSRSLIREATMQQNNHQPWPIFWVREKNCRLVGEGLTPMDRSKRLMIEAVYGEGFCQRAKSFNYLLLPRAKELSGPWTSITSDWSEGFYHWFTDALPRLALLEKFPPETRILVRGPLRPDQRESLKMLGLLKRVRETVENHLVIEDYFFSSPTAMTGCTNPYAVQWLRKKFLKETAAGDTPKRFFIQRRSKTRGIANQEELIRYFQARGWAVVDLETLSLAEQIAYFANAEWIIGEHGGAFTNLLWCQPGCEVIELCPDNFLNGCYEGIALCVGAKHRHYIFPADGNHLFTVPIKSLE